MFHFRFMKKGVATILLALYVVFSTGVVINLHYCMSQLDSSKLGAAKSEICSKCGMNTTDSNGCCHDELKVIKIQDDQKVPSGEITFSSPQVSPDYNSLFVFNILSDNEKEFTLSNHSPPLSKQYTYLQNCVFRI